MVVFFLVSGYVIAHVLQRETTAEFIVKRLFRIYPLYFCAVLLQHAIAPNTVGGADWKTVGLQLLLVGDFFDIQYSLSGVEWSLRVEILFYVFAALCRAAGVISLTSRMLSLAILAGIAGCIASTPFPQGHSVFVAYLSMHGAFTLAGVSFYAYEKGALRLPVLVAVLGATLGQYYAATAAYAPVWLHSHYAIAGFALFCISWSARRFFPSVLPIIWLSDLTYAVYLLHNWLFDTAALKVGSSLIALAILFGTSALLTALIERPGIQLGRAAIYSLRRGRAPIRAS